MWVSVSDWSFIYDPYFEPFYYPLYLPFMSPFITIIKVLVSQKLPTVLTWG